jgi:cytochrome P450
MTTTEARIQHLPTPPGPKLPGALQTFLFPYRHLVMPRLRKRYGDVVAIELLGRPSVLLYTPELNKIVFSGSPEVFHAGEGNRVLRQIMGKHSVLILDEDEHRRMRKLLMPPFHGAALRGYRETMTELAVAEAESWRPGTVFSAHQRMNQLTLEIILRVVFGVVEGPRLDDLRRSITKLVTQPMPIYIGEFVPSLRKYGPWRRFRELVHHVDDLLYAEIAERRKVTDLDNRTDVLSQLLSVRIDGDELSDAELRDQMVTLLLAGHETTATALAWALHDLARDPQLQNRAIQAADEDDEKYLEAVLKEAMRLHPVIYNVARTLTEDIELNGYRIPKGHTVLPGIGVIHGDPAHHPDPQAFRPERFLDGSATPATWLPFGGGVRRCLGAGFAQLEGTIILKEILSRYRLEPERSARERTRARHITLTPARGTRIRVHRR